MADVAKTIVKNIVFFKGFCYFGCWAVGLTSSSNFDRFGVDLWVENRPNIDPKGNRKQDASWDEVWMALGTILGRFLDRSWGPVGPKLAPKSKKRGFQDEVKKSMTNQSRNPF